MGHPSFKPKVFYESFMYQAQSWHKARRVVAMVIRHARYMTFQLAEVAVPRKLFEAILQKIDRLRLLPETG